MKTEIGFLLNNNSFTIKKEIYNKVGNTIAYLFQLYVSKHNIKKEVFKRLLNDEQSDFFMHFWLHGDLTNEYFNKKILEDEDFISRDSFFDEAFNALNDYLCVSFFAINDLKNPVEQGQLNNVYNTHVEILKNRASKKD